MKPRNSEIEQVLIKKQLRTVSCESVCGGKSINHFFSIAWTVFEMNYWTGCQLTRTDGQYFVKFIAFRNYLGLCSCESRGNKNRKIHRSRQQSQHSILSGKAMAWCSGVFATSEMVKNTIDSIYSIITVAQNCQFSGNEAVTARCYAAQIRNALSTRAQYAAMQLSPWRFNGVLEGFKKKKFVLKFLFTINEWKFNFNKDKVQ